jgi:hypothetical protein
MSEYFFNRLSNAAKLNEISSNDNLRSICGESMDISGVYDLNISLDNNAECIRQKFFIVPKLTETCILGIDFVTENAIALNGETRRVTYKINGKSFSFIADTSTLGNEYSNLIQKLNASVATSAKIRKNMSDNVEISQSKNSN